MSALRLSAGMLLLLVDVKAGMLLLLLLVDVKASPPRNVCSGTGLLHRHFHGRIPQLAFACRSHSNMQTPNLGTSITNVVFFLTFSP